MIKVTLPDGTIREYVDGTTSLDVAKSISEGLARNVLASKVDGQVIDATRPLHSDCNMQLLTWNDEEGKSTMWHSSAHLMAEALAFYFPGIKLAIGRRRFHGIWDH
jgi:threonyl-tRNA synthetase